MTHTLTTEMPFSFYAGVPGERETAHPVVKIIFSAEGGGWRAPEPGPDFTVEAVEIINDDGLGDIDKEDLAVQAQDWLDGETGGYDKAHDVWQADNNRAQIEAEKKMGIADSGSVECPYCHWGFAPIAIKQHIREKH